jgi:hypothetical protein
MENTLPAEQKQSSWVLLPFIAFSVWRLGDSMFRGIPIYAAWNASGRLPLSAEQEYQLWMALGGVCFSLLLPIPLIMTRVNRKYMWALGVLWVVLFAGELAVDHYEERAYARRRADPPCGDCCRPIVGQTNAPKACAPPST